MGIVCHAFGMESSARLRRAPLVRAGLRGFSMDFVGFCQFSIKVFLLIDGRIPSLRCGIDAPPAFGGLRLPIFFVWTLDGLHHFLI